MAAGEQPGREPGNLPTWLTSVEPGSRRLGSPLSGIRIPVYTSRKDAKNNLAAAARAEREHTIGLESALIASIEQTRSNAEVIPNLVVVLLNTKSSGKTATAFHLGQAFAYASDITTTNFDANHDPALHTRFGYTDEQLPGLTSMKQFAAQVQGMVDPELAYSVLNNVYSTNQGVAPETLLRAQAEAVAAMKVGDIRRLKALRIRSPLGMGFIAGNTEALTDAEAKSVMFGGSLVSDYNIVEAGNEIGIATGQTDVRNFVYGADQLMMTVHVGTRDSWRLLGLNMQRLDTMSKNSPKEGEALTKKSKESIVVISGLDSAGYEYDPTGTLYDFLTQSGIVDYHGPKNYEDGIMDFLKREEIVEGESGIYIGGISFNGFIRGVPEDPVIAEDVNYNLLDLQIPTQLAYQNLANTLQYCRGRQIYQQEIRRT